VILTLATFIAGLFGVKDILKIQKWMSIGVIVLLLVVLVTLGLFLRSCLNRKPKLDEQAIQKAQNAIAENDRKQMLEVLAESDTKEAEIDSTIKQIEMDREAAKKSYADKSNEELAAELERRLAQ